MAQESEADGVRETNISEEKSPISLFDAYQLGTLIGYIRYTCQNTDQVVYYIRDDKERGLIKYCLDKVISDLKGYEEDFVVVDEIEKMRDRLQDNYLNSNDIQDVDGELDPEDKVIHLTESDTEELVDATSTWENLLSNQLRDQTRIPVSEVGLFNTKKAMESPEMLFDDKRIWEDLPDDVTRDLSEACRSLASGCPTSAVFLSLRAVEQKLHTWYVEETGNEIEDRTFGQVLGEIDDQYDDDSRPRVLDHLDYLVDRRNEVAHAEETPDQQEAENTLMLSRTTISNISEKLST